MASGEGAKLGVVDVETTKIQPGRRPRTKFWGLAVEGEGYRRFEKSDELIRFLNSRTDKLRLYNHHDFDPSQLIVDKYFPGNLRMRGARIIRCDVAGTDWVNSYALFPDGLAAILKACGKQKLPLGCNSHRKLAGCLKCEKRDGDGDLKFPDGCDNHSIDECEDCQTALGERNVSDTSGALECFLQLGTEYFAACGVDPVREGFTTAASAAFAAAEKVAGAFPVNLRNHESYRGGRTEAFRVGDCGTATSWDINSSYPASFLDLPDTDWLWHARVKISKEDAPRPFFANGPREEGLKFPAGRFDTWFFGNSYERYIRPHGGIEEITKIEKIPVDLRWIKRTSGMIERLYKMRVEAADRPALRYALKIFLNSLYGRMGMKPGGQQSFRSPVQPPSGAAFRIGPNNFLCFKSVYRKPKANYALAAAVTDNARARLYDGMMKAGDVFYCDTDSIYTPTKRAPKGIQIHKSALGAWKKEKTGPLRVRTVKDYEFAGEEKRKGGGKSSLWTVRLAAGNLPVRAVDRQRRTGYDKRRVRRDGSTAPLIY